MKMWIKELFFENMSLNLENSSKSLQTKTSFRIVIKSNYLKNRKMSFKMRLKLEVLSI